MSSIRWMIACSIIVLASFTTRAADPAPDLTPEKLQQLVKQLGDENYDNRKNAEKELSHAGVKAKDALTAAANSSDAQVKATAKRLLGRLKFTSLGPINYFDVLPESLIAVKFSNISDTLTKGEGTFLAKFINAKHFDPLRQKFKEEMEKDAEGKKMFELWTNRFRGQVAGALWDLNFMMPNGVKAAAVLEVTDGDPTAVLNDLLDLAGEPGEKTVHNDVDVIEMPNQKGAFALAGNHLIIATSAEAANTVIDNFGNAAPKGINQDPVFAKVKPAAGARSDALLLIHIEKLLQLFGMMMPPGSDDMFASSGLKDMKMIVYNSAINGESFEDRLTIAMDGPAKGFRLAAQIPADAPPPLEALALVPSNAAGAQVSYIDGSKMGSALKDYFASLVKIGNAQRQARGQPASPDVEQVITQLETATGVKLNDFTANIKGTAAAWVVLGPPPSTSAPDIGLLLTCVDAEKAKSTAATLAAAVNKGTAKEAIKEVPWKTRTIYQVDIATLNPNLPKDFPYPQPCFTVDGNRLFIGSSSQSLQKQLNNVEAKAPGLLTNPDFVKAMGSLKPEDRKGAVGYVDLKSLATLGGNVGLPLLAASSPDEEFKKFLQTLPPAADIFKDMPPLIYTSNDRGDRQEMIMRAPMPPLLTLYGGVFGFGMYASRRAVPAM